jgi:hypothetical protein
MKVLPGPVVIVIEVGHLVADPGVTESDVIRWIGVAVAVAGAILATPAGIASLSVYVQQQRHEAMALARRLLRRPSSVTIHLPTARITLTAPTGHVHIWQPWLPEANFELKIDILHKQIDILQGEINELRAEMDRTSDDLQRKINEAEARVEGLVRQVSSEIPGERSEASRVDARGFGPIALGIILAGVPDGLATVAPVGWLAVAVSIIWTATAWPGWLRDYKRALRLESAKD